MSETRTWRWSPSNEEAWPAPPWSHEYLDTPRARWFARIATPEAAAHPPIVFVHGVVVSGSYFWPVARHLAGEFPLFVPDLPGTGRSTRRDGGWSIEEQAGGLAAWMDLHGLRHSVLVANSLGAQVVTMLAVKRPDLAVSLVLVAPTTDPDAATVIEMLVRGLRDIPRESPSLWRIWLPDLVRTGPWRGLKHLRAGLRDAQVERLGDLDMPVVVVGGEHDPIAPVGWVDAIAGAVEESRSVIVPGAPHAMNYTTPGNLARIIRAVARQCGGEASTA